MDKPGEALHAWRGLAKGFSLGEGPLLERAPSQRLGEASSLAGVPSSPSVLCLLDRAHMGSVSFRRVTGAATQDDASAVVVVLVYKAVNKAAPSKGVARVATLVLRRPSAAPLQGRRHRGAHSKPLQRRPTVLAGRWLFPALVMPSPAMDRDHGLQLYCAPCLLLGRHVVALPAKIFGGRGPRHL